MSIMADYRVPLREIRFCLSLFADTAGNAAAEASAQDIEDAVLEEAARLAETVLAPLYRLGDVRGAELVGGQVTLPEEIKAAYAEGEAMPIQMHDGSTIVLRKVDRDYDLTSRASAFKYLRERFNAGEITTGLLYLDESRAEMHELMGNIDTPLSQVPFERLNPGSAELKKLQGRYR